MKTILGWMALLVLVGICPAAEEAIDVAPDLKGAWVTPDAEWDGRSVLLLHGFASDMNDAGGSLKQLAEALAAKGIASLRINFRGEGDVMRSNIESTFITRLEDAAAAYAFLGKQRGVDLSRIGVHGFSLGGSTALQTAGQHPRWFKSMVLWSAPSGDLFAMWKESPTAQKALAEGVASEDVPGWKTITTKRAFYESFRGVDTDQALAKYPGAFLTIRGSNDFVAHRDAELLKLAPGEPKKAVLVEGADHTFNVFVPEKNEMPRVIAQTVAWFERTL